MPGFEGYLKMIVPQFLEVMKNNCFVEMFRFGGMLVDHLGLLVLARGAKILLGRHEFL